MTSRVRTLIVDDSQVMRTVLTRLLSSDPDIEVVGAAPEPFAAREMIKALNPDVLTLDVEMPGMDGLSFLERIMRLRPMPVVMCSTMTERGAEVTIEALRLGAVDYFTKPRGADDLAREGASLCAKVKAAARSAVQAGPIRTAPPPRPTGVMSDVVIAVGASTGGVEALFALLRHLPRNTPPVLVVQHMPQSFTRSFASRLNAECEMNVVEATDGDRIVPGTVYIAPGGAKHMELVGGHRGTIRLFEGEPVNGHRPSADVLFHSIVPFARRAIGVILTGMGNDGAAGLLAMREAGARTLGQNEASCVVYGMPRVAKQMGAVTAEIALCDMPEALLNACSTSRRAA